MEAKLKFLLVLLSLAFYITRVAEAQKSCGFEGLNENSEDDPIVLPPVSDNLPGDSSIDMWRVNFYGSVNRVNTLNNAHFAYATGAKTGSDFYRIYPNARTKNFTRAFSTRTMKRTVYVFCNGEAGEVATYHLQIPFQDMSPPQFSEPKYTFNIPSGWKIANPISSGNFVIVSDNAYEIDEDPKGFLSYDIIGLEEPTEIEVNFVKLWTQSIPAMFPYRLDFKLNTPLPPGGTSLQFALSVRDQFNSGSTVIELNISD